MLTDTLVGAGLMMWNDRRLAAEAPGDGASGVPEGEALQPGESSVPAESSEMGEAGGAARPVIDPL